MSDELLAAADARPDSVRTHYVGCYKDHDLCLIARLADRVRELIIERNKAQTTKSRLARFNER